VNGVKSPEEDLIHRALLLLVLLAWSGFARPDTYPSKPVRLLVSVPAGGHADMVARLVGTKLGEALGRPFVVDNRGGGGGVVAEEMTARSVPDGYTILQVALGHVVNPALNSKLTYDPERDLVPVSLVVSVPNVLVVNRKVPVQSVPELIALAKSKPDELTYAAGYASSLHMAGELFKAMAGVDILHVSYKSGGLAIPDLEAGRVDMAFSVMSSAMSMLKNGRVRALAVTSAQRSQVMPDLPAMAEFVPGYELTGWQGILAPARTPRAIIDTLSGEIAKIMRLPDVQARLLASGADPVGSTPEEFAAVRKAEFAKYKKLVAKAGIKPIH
jgi:tripartite-type tricarboxylate transporter receptor subunit TctC